MSLSTMSSKKMIFSMVIILTGVIAINCLHRPLYVREYTPMKVTITGSSNNNDKISMTFVLDNRFYSATLEPFRGSVPSSWAGHLEERSNVQMFDVRLTSRPQSDGQCFIDRGSVLCAININRKDFLIEPYHWYHPNHSNSYNAVGYWSSNLKRCSDSDPDTCKNSKCLYKPSGWPLDEGPLIGEAARSKWRKHQPPPIKDKTGMKVAPRMSKLSTRVDNDFQNQYNNSTQLLSTKKNIGSKLVVIVTKSSSKTSPKVIKKLNKYINKTRINSTNFATHQKTSEQTVTSFNKKIVSKTGPKQSKPSPRVTTTINIMNDTEISYRKQVNISKKKKPVNKQGLLSNEKNFDSETDPRMPKASANVTKPVKIKMKSNGISDRKLTTKRKKMRINLKQAEFDPLKNQIQSGYKCVKKMDGYYDKFCHEHRPKHNKWMDNTKWPCVPHEGYFDPLCITRRSHMQHLPNFQYTTRGY